MKKKPAAPVKKDSKPLKRPLFWECLEAIKQDPDMNFLQKSIAYEYIFERRTYTPPQDASRATSLRVFLSAARAYAFLYCPRVKSEEGAGQQEELIFSKLPQETQERFHLNKFILAPNSKAMPAPPFTKTLEEWTNFFRSAEQARQTYLSQFESLCPLKPIKLHATRKSGFLPTEDELIIFFWIMPRDEWIPLSHCTGELACDFISKFSNAGNDPKNFPRKKSKLGLVSYPKAEFSGLVGNILS